MSVCSLCVFMSVCVYVSICLCVVCSKESQEVLNSWTHYDNQQDSFCETEGLSLSTCLFLSLSLFLSVSASLCLSVGFLRFILPVTHSLENSVAPPSAVTMKPSRSEAVENSYKTSHMSVGASVGPCCQWRRHTRCVWCVCAVSESVENT